MRKIIYYVATSVDGFISGPDEDVSRFTANGDGVRIFGNSVKPVNLELLSTASYDDDLHIITYKINISYYLPQTSLHSPYLLSYLLRRNRAR